MELKLHRQSVRVYLLWKDSTEMSPVLGRPVMCTADCCDRQDKVKTETLLTSSSNGGRTRRRPTISRDNGAWLSDKLDQNDRRCRHRMPP